MLDLDTIQARADEARLRPTTVPGYLVTKAEIAAVVASAEDVPALVAELRDTRNARETAIATVARWERAYQEQAAKHEAERAELRAAREAVDAAWAHRLHFGACVDPQLNEALDAYEKATKETSQ